MGLSFVIVLEWLADVLLVFLATFMTAYMMDPECHRYYAAFHNPELPYHAVGRLADRMYERGCWPIVQEMYPELINPRIWQPTQPIEECASDDIGGEVPLTLPGQTPRC